MCGGAVIHNPPCRRSRVGLQGLGIQKCERINSEELGKIETDDEFQGGFSFGTRQKRNNAEKKEKSRDAARERRAKESDYFQELEELLPMVGSAPSTSVSMSVDKTSLIRLTLAHLKIRSFIELGLPKPTVKEEVNSDVDQVDFLSCVNGFNLVLGAFGDLMYVSNNVHKFIGLTSTELTGQVLADYVHPCDHRQLDLLTPNMEGQAGEERVEVFLRMKCTVTERGRIINLKQASYKTLKVSGKAISMPCPEEGAGGLVGTVFMGLASLIGPQLGTPSQIGVFSSKHSQDMKFMEAENWFSTVAGYRIPQILGQSFFDFVHTGDIANIQTSFRNLREQGQCETPAYRLLVSGGGWAWVQTAASLTSARRGGSKGQTVTCLHQQITEVQDRDKILALVQMETETGTEHKYKTQKQQTPRKVTPEPTAVHQMIKGETQETDSSTDNIMDFLSFEPLDLMAEILSEDRLKIEPRKKENKEQHNSKIISKSATSQPTSVIVNPRTSEVPKAVTQSLFRKINSKPATYAINNKKSPNTEKIEAVTSSFFCKPQKVAGKEKNSEDNLPSNNFGISKIEEEIFASLFAFDNVEELDTLAPHIGDDFVTIKSLSEPDVLEIEEVKNTFLDEGIEANLMPQGNNSTSVIVEPRTTEGPKTITRSLFKKIDSRPETKVIDAKTPPNKEKTEGFALKAVTSSFFCKPQKVASAEIKSNENIPSKDFEISTVEEDIFASLLAFNNTEDLETLAPHGGDDFVAIKSLLEPDVLEMENQPKNNVEEGMESNLMTQSKDPIDELFEEEENEMINPRADTMWGGPRTLSPELSFLSPGWLNLKPGKLLTASSSTTTSEQWTGYVDVSTNSPSSCQGPSWGMPSLVKINPQTTRLPLEEPLDFNMEDLEGKYCPISLKKHA